MAPLNFCLAFLAIFLANVLASAQNIPRIVVLYPNNISASEEILEELKVYEKKLEVTEEMKAKFVNPNLPKHWQINRSRLLEFLKEQDFFSLVTKSTSDNLTYLLNKDHDVIINFPVKDESSADLNNYRRITEKYKVAWLVNFTSVKLTKELDRAVIKAHIQLYNSVSDRIWINKDYLSKSGEDCETSQWECSLSDLIGTSTSDLYDLLEQKRHYWGTDTYERVN